MTSAATALPKLFGSDDTMREELVKLRIEYATLKGAFDQLTTQLIKDHVLKDQKFITDQMQKKETNHV